METTLAARDRWIELAKPTGDEADSKASNCMRWLYGKRERISVSRSILAAA